MALDGLKSRLQQARRILPQVERPNPLSVAKPVQPPPATRNVALRAHLGQDGFDAGNAAVVHGAPAPGPIGKTPPEPTPEEARRAAIDRAVETGEPQEFVNSDGETVTVQIEQTRWPFDGDTRVVRVDDEEFTVKFDTEGEVDKNAMLTQLVDSYSETPEEYRGELDEVVITSDTYETDTGQPAAASAGGNKMTFYNNGDFLTEEVFHHEMGHLAGRKAENSNDGFFDDWFGEPSPVPPGWDDAARSDGNFVGEYAEADHDVDGDYTEDFAEAYAHYMQAVDEGPEAVEAFQEQYPARYEILKDMVPA